MKLFGNPKVDAVYRKGIDEGFQQGYWQAKKELDAKIEGLRVEMQKNNALQTEKVQDVESKLEVAVDQLNLLGRLVGQLTERENELSSESKAIIADMDRILKKPKAEE
ncbi:MAG: hypothetical protein FJ358_02850 [Thaumarchaeota archaeon]|nr:hypothetical protein [Nitrososphaerota archaeon]